MQELTALAAVMALSLPLALGLVWLCLLGAFHLLPHARRRLRAAASPALGTAGPEWAATHSKGLPRAFQAGLDR